MGLAGLGDLVLTCTGDLSRNRRVGLALARGEPLPAILAALGHVAEGVSAARAVRERSPLLTASRCRSAKRSIACCTRNMPVRDACSKRCCASREPKSGNDRAQDVVAMRGRRLTAAGMALACAISAVMAVMKSTIMPPADASQRRMASP